MLTPYQKRQKDEDFTFDNVKRRRNTKDEQRRSKEQKKVKKRFQNKCVSSQNKQYEKRRGRHRSGYTYLPSQRADATVVRRP